MYKNLGSFVKDLRSKDWLCEVCHPVDPNQELAEIHRRVIAAGGPALLFTNVVGKKFPVLTNMFGTRERIDLAFGDNPTKFVEELASIPKEFLPPTLGKIWDKRKFFLSAARVGFKRYLRAPVLAHQIAAADLTQLPAITSWPEDGGPFLTLPLVHTVGTTPKPENLGMYRVQIFDSHEMGMHFQIGKGAGFHLHEAELLEKPLHANVYLGGPPALVLSAIAPLPENVPELLLGSLLLGAKLGRARTPSQPIDLVAEAEFVIVGAIPPKVRRPEGPFGDHYGYYSLQHPYPVFRPRAIYHRDKAIFPATVVGKPRQEDFYLGDYLQELLSPIFPIVMPAVKDLWSYGETGFHALSVAQLSERYYKESMSSVFRILGEGQLSLTKFLIGIDKAIPLKNFKKVLEYVLERVHWERDLYVFSQLSMDTLDYTGPKINRGSKGVILGMGDPCRVLPKVFDKHINSSLVKKAIPFTPGCLIVETLPFSEQKQAACDLANLECFSDWPLLVAVDSAKIASSSQASFLWTTFTRFNPASDLYARSYDVHRHRVSYGGPIVIDARMKPSYPKELFCHSAVKDKVDKNWKNYFPNRDVPMGSSDWANLL